jgi:hypothetical protein
MMDALDEIIEMIHQDVRIVLAYLIEQIGEYTWMLDVGSNCQVSVRGSTITVTKPVSMHKFDAADPECHLKVKACIDKREPYITLNLEGHFSAIAEEKLKDIFLSNGTRFEKYAAINAACVVYNITNEETMDYWLDTSKEAWEDLEKELEERWA